MEKLFTDPGSLTTEEWLAVCILGFILMAVLVMTHRLLTIMKMSRKSTYRPNFRRLRRYHPPPGDNTGQDKESDS